MKKTIVIFLCIFALLITGCRTAKLEDVKIEKLRYVSGETDISEELSEGDARALSVMFSNRKLAQDWPTCSFSDDSVLIAEDGQEFCFSSDGCGTIYCKDSGLYFTFSEEESEILFTILHRYGVEYPGHTH